MSLRSKTPPKIAMFSKSDAGNESSFLQSSFVGSPDEQELFKSGVQDHPLISIITVVYNGAASIEQTIRSIVEQTYRPIEFIIIDGGSSDGTLEIIRRHEQAISYWLSEPDQGIADAMNKGIRLAKGDFIIFLHADDYFAGKHSLEEAVKCIEDSDEIVACEILYGQTLKRLTSRGFNFWMNFKTGIYHQGTLCSRQLLQKMHGFDIRFKIAMDYDFFLRAYHAGVRIRKSRHVLSIMRDTGISAKSDWLSLSQRFSEEKKVHMKSCRSQRMKWLYGLYWFLYIPYRRMKMQIWF